MALNPRGTRQRDGAAQLSQNRPEYRLFDENSSSAISPVIEVWNEPVVIHAHALAPGQGIAVDCVSDYDNNPVYTPFTPIRGAPIVLTEDLTSVILFFSGRYVLRLTGGGLGTVKAFAYPFSVSHDWGDYYGGLGFGGNVVTSIDDIDTNTIDITLNPDPGTGDVTIRADAILSPDADNIQEFRANGFFVQGPDNGNIINVPTSVLDTATIDLTLAANVLSAVVIRSPDAGQILELRANGVYVPGPQLGDPTQVPTSVLDTLSVDLTLAANVLSADVIISPNPGNALSLLANGLFVTGFAGTITTAADTNTINHTVAVGVLTSDVIRSPDVGNLLELRANGVYTGVGTAATSVVDTQSIDLTLAANILQADLRIDPSAENALNLSGAGVLVEQATTAEEEAEAAGDLVINAVTLGHIVNARTATRSSHLGVIAGSLTADQVALGYSAGNGATGIKQIAVGAYAGMGVTGVENISIGYNASTNVSGNNNIHIGYQAGASRTKSNTIILDPTGVAADHGDYSIIAGFGATQGATNINGTVVMAIGSGALTNANVNNKNDVTAIGYGALNGFTQLGGGGASTALAVGTAAGSFSRANTAMFVGTDAGVNFANAKTTTDDIVIAVGPRAGYASFTDAPIPGELGKILLAVGYGAGSSLKSYRGSTTRPAVGDQVTWGYLFHGYNCGVGSETLEVVCVGSANLFYSGAKMVTAIGDYAGYDSAFTESLLIGRRAGAYQEGTTCTFIGVNSGYGLNNYSTNFSAVFTQAAMNDVTDTVTLAGHGKSVGTYLTAWFVFSAGTPPTGIPGEPQVLFVEDANTFRVLRGFTLAGAFTARLLYTDLTPDNAICLGYGTEFTASNQITLGNQFIEEVRTAGKIYPGGETAGYQTATSICAGTGAPNNANGNNGDFYLRSDGGALTTIYQKRAGVWTGIV